MQTRLVAPGALAMRFLLKREYDREVFHFNNKNAFNMEPCDDDF